MFVAVAEELQFSRAAVRLHLPQSVVSEQVRRLEIELGLELFDRSRRAIQLTADGAAILRLARDLLGRAQAITDEAGRRVETPRVQRLGVPSGMGRRLTAILRSLALHGVTARPHAIDPARRTTMLLDGSLDAAIIRGEIRSDALWTSHVWDERIVAALPDHHPLAERAFATLPELAATPVAIVERSANPALHDLLNAALAGSGRVLTPGIPFSGIESTFAELATSRTPMWTPVFEGYEAEHSYEGMVTLPVEPALYLPSFLAVGPHITRPLRQLYVDACRSAGTQG
ncbi:MULTISPECIES: LysR family transcriptional regulator [unclassified Microbacterium]|uniref:LysR family transcriptional regulator n=2 Tax=Microbacteriaceae TaxID=85023 RepID=UPI0005652C35|nr:MULTISPECIES: LysR family transcriptional regulator [unclassified Microbacterium]